MKHLIAIAFFHSLLACCVALSAVRYSTIPRTDAQQYIRDGLFEGGTATKANLETIRFAPHPNDVERWVIDFSDPKTREIGKLAPKFQLYYYDEKTSISDKGIPFVETPPKFVFLFRSIDKVFLTQSRINKLVKGSRFVKEAILYPPIEEGDMAIELILKKNVSFKPHQPISREGRLVLDMKTFR